MQNDHGSCPNCKTDLNGGSIWQTGFDLALSNGGDTHPSIPAKTKEEAEKRADLYASHYGATREAGQWGREIGIYDLEKDRTVSWQCPDCNHIWPR